ncbi:hypothetical protein XENTR_v10017615 [Xenopus tropicalis]|nr:hypothetical protein XENTR_v10017615 [Xenopus tropicalis]
MQIPIKQNGFLAFSLTAARTVIPRLWKSTRPTVGDWAIELNHIMRMEEMLTHTIKSREHFTKVWTTQILYKESPEYNKLLATLSRLKYHHMSAKHN